MTTFDQLIQHRRDFEVTEFADLSHPCTPVESGFLTLGTVLLMLSPVLIVGFFMVL